MSADRTSYLTHFFSMTRDSESGRERRFCIAHGIWKWYSSSMGGLNCLSSSIFGKLLKKKFVAKTNFFRKHFLWQRNYYVSRVTPAEYFIVYMALAVFDWLRSLTSRLPGYCFMTPLANAPEFAVWRTWSFLQRKPTLGQDIRCSRWVVATYDFPNPPTTTMGMESQLCWFCPEENPNAFIWAMILLWRLFVSTVIKCVLEYKLHRTLESFEMNWNLNGKNQLQSKNKVQYVAQLDPNIENAWWWFSCIPCYKK